MENGVGSKLRPNGAILPIGEGTRIPSNYYPLGTVQHNYSDHGNKSATIREDAWCPIADLLQRVA